MKNPARITEGEQRLVFCFLLTFGADWVENDRVRDFIAANQIDGVGLHKFLEQRVDHANLANGITHRRLAPGMLDEILKHKFSIDGEPAKLDV